MNELQHLIDGMHTGKPVLTWEQLLVAPAQHTVQATEKSSQAFSKAPKQNPQFEQEHLEVYNLHGIKWPPSAMDLCVIDDSMGMSLSQRAKEVIFLCHSIHEMEAEYELMDANVNLNRHNQHKTPPPNPWSKDLCPSIFWVHEASRTIQ